MRSPMIVLSFLGFVVTNGVQADDLKTDCAAGLNYNYTGGIIGISISDGLHLQGSCSVTHTDTGIFAEVWGTTDGYLASDSYEFGYEIDGTVGWRNELFDGRVGVQADYSIFWVESAGRIKDIKNTRLFLSWKKGAVKPYAALQYFLTDDFGPGEGLGYKVGLRFNEFSVEAGGHNGLFGRSAEMLSFGRVGYTSKPIEHLFGASVSVTFQKGFVDPLEDRLMFGINKSF